MAPIESMGGFKPGSGINGDEYSLLDFVAADKKGKVCQKQEGWKLPLAGQAIETSGALVIDSHELDIFSLWQLGPKTFFGLTYTKVLPSSGCQVSYKADSSILGLSAEQKGQKAVCRIETSLLGNRNAIFSGIVTIAMAGLYLLPVELLGKVSDCGLVIMEAPGFSDSRLVGLLPGKLLGKTESPDILYPSGVLPSEIKPWKSKQDIIEEQRSLIEKIRKTKPVALVFS